VSYINYYINHAKRLSLIFLLLEHCFGFNDISRHTHPNGPYTFSHLCLSLIKASVINLLLAWWVTSFFPRKFGYFLLDDCKNNNSKMEKDETPHNSEETDFKILVETTKSEIEIEPLVKSHNRKFEPVDKSQPILRTITNLNKSPLRLSNTVVRDFSLNIYKNQITILLGTKGVGKTTIINMLLRGKIPPSADTISVDSESSDKFYRHQIGFCPQHSSFIPYLNCLENLLFFGQLRGLPVVEACKQAEQILKEVNLTAKVNMPVQTLSIGMQRRLALACAMIGETTLLVLDEPSSGLDYESRRELWDVLLRVKQTRTILISTHDAEEADVLGDKIAIIDSSEVIAYGSSFFLKRECGNGYTLKLRTREEQIFPSDQVLNLIQNIIPSAEVRESTGSLMSVGLPYENQKDYVRLLEQLEERQHDLGIESIDITNITLQEVFLK
jgi:ATP-binding cassette, subfamily A (ABC1), member 3